MGTMNVTRPEYKIHPDDYYEAIIDSISEEENSFYDPKEPNKGTPKQFKFVFKFMDKDGEEADLWAFTSQILSKKSKLGKLCEAVIPNFDPDQPLNEEDLLGKKVRINIKTKIVKDQQRNVVDSFSPSQAEKKSD